MNIYLRDINEVFFKELKYKNISLQYNQNMRLELSDFITYNTHNVVLIPSEDDGIKNRNQLINKDSNEIYTVEQEEDNTIHYEPANHLLTMSNIERVAFDIESQIRCARINENGLFRELITMDQPSNYYELTKMIIEFYDLALLEELVSNNRTFSDILKSNDKDLPKIEIGKDLFLPDLQIKASSGIDSGTWNIRKIKQEIKLLRNGKIIKEKRREKDLSETEYKLYGVISLYALVYEFMIENGLYYNDFEKTKKMRANRTGK